jgi:hypothetical protein
MVRLLCWVSRPHFGAQGLIMSYNVTTLLDQPSDQGTLSSAGGWKDWERRWSLSARGLDIGNGTKQAEFTLKLAPGQIVPSCWNARRLTAPGLQCAPSAYTVGAPWSACGGNSWVAHWHPPAGHVASCALCSPLCDNQKTILTQQRQGCERDAEDQHDQWLAPTV